MATPAWWAAYQLGTLALCLGAGIGSEVAGALLQLGIHLLGLILAGTARFLVQRLVWRHIGVPENPVRAGDAVSSLVP